jgi:RNA polymerase sigma factor (TIGR02999 family)
MDSAARSSSSSATALLLDWTTGAAGAENARAQLQPLVYEELRRIARLYLRRERSDHTLQATALVHEAYLRLIDQRSVDWRNRAQFIGLAATMMRRVLINYARDRAAAKRGGDVERVSLTLAEDVAESPAFDVIALNEALERLEAIDPRKSRIVELKFFGGLTTAETADVLELSHATIERDWKLARAWLYDSLSSERQSTS